MPGFGNESIPRPSGPQSLITDTGEGQPRRVMTAKKRRTTRGSRSIGSTHWYCAKPRGP